MIDINELRRLARRYVGMTAWSPTSPKEVLELLDRLEDAESDALEQARLNGVGSKREAALVARLVARLVTRLVARLEAAEKEVAHIKEVEFPRKMRAVAVGWETKCARLEQERDALQAKVEATERQEPVAWCATDETGTVIEALGMNQSRRFDTALYLAPGAQPAPSMPDTHNDMVMGLDYQGAMSCARQRAKQEAGLLYPEGDARKEEMERELAGEYYRQYTTPNPGATP